MLKLKKYLIFSSISLAINNVVKSSFQKNIKENSAVKCHCGARKEKFRTQATLADAQGGFPTSYKTAHNCL